jgi:hypothetical protein
MGKSTITLTFKEEEKYIYNHIALHSSKGGYLKDLVKNDIKKEEKPRQNEDRVLKLFEV